MMMVMRVMMVSMISVTMLIVVVVITSYMTIMVTHNDAGENDDDIERDDGYVVGFDDDAM